ncbi:MAG: SLBB domain-containing protein [Armatimonadota bacterium]|nr:SLBB domain-containing protein [Armatimonadota bacterium]
MVADSKRGVGRQIHLPLGRAFLISVKSIKIRFWRSVITAAGIFLGIAFLVSVLAQLALQAPPVPKEFAYPNVYVRGMVKRPLDKSMEPGITAKSVIETAGGYATKADKRTVTVVKKEGDRVILDFENAATPDTRLAAGDLVFVPDSGGRLKQLIVALVVLTAAIVGLVLCQRVADRKKRIVSTTAVIVLGIFALSFGLTHSGLTPPKTPKVTVVQSYHTRGELKVPTDQPAGGGVTLEKALATSGGFAGNADRRHVIVIKRNAPKKQVDLKTAQGAALARTLTLGPGDLVYVPDATARNRQIWLVIMSLVVCTIGISNSMLMSVTERFKEIGTMKCLGALDKFVVELFLLEAMLLGVGASFAGWVVGFGLMALLAGATQGWGLLLQLTMVEILRMLGIAVGVGTALTTIATIAPAIRAAQMPPAAALRVEI